MPSWEEDHLRSTECHFPKHRGESWWRVCAIDVEYAQWIIDTIEDLDEDLKDAIEWGIKHVPSDL
jgi:hypothetical protein